MASDKTVAPFAFGEWAVLRNEQGGRLFHCGEAKPHPVIAHMWSITEQKTRPSHGDYSVNSEYLIKVLHKDQACELVGALCLIKTIENEEIRTARKKAENRIALTIESYKFPPEFGT